MIQEYKLNTSELTYLKHEKKQYLEFLPILKMKQEQLQIEKNRIKKIYFNSQKTYKIHLVSILKNASVFSDSFLLCDLKNIFCPKDIIISYKYIAGISIPILREIHFRSFIFNIEEIPYWLTLSIYDIQILVLKHIDYQILFKQYILIQNALNKAIRKVNLFEKVLIPHTEHIIKIINIFLGDEQRASIGRAKIAKKKGM